MTRAWFLLYLTRSLLSQNRVFAWVRWPSGAGAPGRAALPGRKQAKTKPKPALDQPFAGALGTLPGLDPERGRLCPVLTCRQGGLCPRGPGGLWGLVGSAGGVRWACCPGGVLLVGRCRRGVVAGGGVPLRGRAGGPRWCGGGGRGVGGPGAPPGAPGACPGVAVGSARGAPGLALAAPGGPVASRPGVALGGPVPPWCAGAPALAPSWPRVGVPLPVGARWGCPLVLASRCPLLPSLDQSQTGSLLPALPALPAFDPPLPSRSPARFWPRSGPLCLPKRKPKGSRNGLFTRSLPSPPRRACKGKVKTDPKAGKAGPGQGKAKEKSRFGKARARVKRRQSPHQNPVK